MSSSEVNFFVLLSLFISAVVLVCEFYTSQEHPKSGFACVLYFEIIKSDPNLSSCLAFGKEKS